jgi:phage-related holin
LFMFAMIDSMHPCLCTEPPTLELFCCSFLCRLDGVVAFADLSSEMGNLVMSFKPMIL